MTRRARTLLAAAAIACGPGCWTNGQLWVVNGLDVPVKVSVEGQVVELKPGDRKPVSLRSGPHTVEATTLDGAGREVVKVEVPRWSGAAVYNVAGAAPLYTFTVFYGTGTGSPTSTSNEILCGQRTFKREVDLYFEDPPQVSSKAVTKTSLLLNEGGWLACVNLLEAKGMDQAAANMLPGVRAMHPTDLMAFAEARLRLILSDEEGALALLRETAAKSNSRNAHLVYQQYGAMLGKRQELVREYRERAARAPEDPEQRYLAALLLPSLEAVGEFKALLEQLPEDAEMRLALAWALSSSGQFAVALRTLEPLGDGATLSTDDRVRLAHRRVWALAALGKPEEAIQVVRAEARRPERVDLPLLVRQGLLAVKMGRPDLEPDPMAIDAGRNRLDSEWRRVTYDGQVHPERLDRARIQGLTSTRTLAPVLANAAADPRSALLALRHSTNYDAQLLPQPVALVLLAEAWRAGDRYAERTLLHGPAMVIVDFPELRRYVLEGRPAQEMGELWEDRGAIHLARARVLRAQGNAAAAALEEKLVRLHDVYSGVATRALESWPSTAAGVGTAVLFSSGKQGGKRPEGPKAAPVEVEYRLVRVEGLTLEPER